MLALCRPRAIGKTASKPRILKPEITLEHKSHRLAILILSIIGLLSTYPMTITTFAYGIGNSTYIILLLYPTMSTATILVMTKVRLGYIITLISSIAYAVLLMRDVGHYAVFEPDNFLVLAMLIIPFLTFLLLIPLTIYQLYPIKWIRVGAITVSTSILIFSFAERLYKNYDKDIFINAQISPNGLIALTVGPSFGDTRVFHINSDSKELMEFIKNQAEYHQGDYLLLNTSAVVIFQLSTLKSFTIEKIGSRQLDHPITWSSTELKGETDFLKP